MAPGHSTTTWLRANNLFPDGDLSLVLQLIDLNASVMTYLPNAFLTSNAFASHYHTTYCIPYTINMDTWTCEQNNTTYDMSYTTTVITRQTLTPHTCCMTYDTVMSSASTTCCGIFVVYTSKSGLENQEVHHRHSSFFPAGRHYNRVSNTEYTSHVRMYAYDIMHNAYVRTYTYSNWRQAPTKSTHVNKWISN